MHFYFQDPGRQRKGAKHAALAEQRIIIPGVGLAVGSHGEEGRAALFFLFFNEWGRQEPVSANIVLSLQRSN